MYKNSIYTSILSHYGKFSWIHLNFIHPFEMKLFKLHATQTKFLRKLEKKGDWTHWIEHGQRLFSVQISRRKSREKNANLSHISYSRLHYYANMYSVSIQTSNSLSSSCFNFGCLDERNKKKYARFAKIMKLIQIDKARIKF